MRSWPPNWGRMPWGLFFTRKAPEKVPPETAGRSLPSCRPSVAAVGVFVDEDAAVVRDLAGRVGLDWVQLHGQESPEYCRNLGRR